MQQNEKVPWLLYTVPDCFGTLEMCFRVVEKRLHPFRFIPDHIKTQELSNNGVDEEPSSLQYVPDYFVTQKQKMAC